MINKDFGVPWGPWGWGCGHDVEDVDREEAVSLGLMADNQRIEADPKSFNENLQASANGLDPDLLAKLKSAFGDQINIDGDSIRWVYKGEPGPAVPAEQALALPPADENQNPVSDAIKIKASGTLRESVKTALAAIDQVHDDGALPEIPLENTTRQTRGFFRPKRLPDGTLTAEMIGVRSVSSHPALTTIHEIGHFLDLDAIGAAGNYATLSGDPDMARVIEVAKKSDAIKKFQAKLASTRNPDTIDQMNYLLKPQEIWARSYAQFIAERANNNTLTRELQDAFNIGKQWTKDDFAPIATAIETMFRNLGWL